MLVHVQKAPQNACLKNEIDQIKINYNNKSKILDQLFCSIPSHKRVHQGDVYYHTITTQKLQNKIKKFYLLNLIFLIYVFSYTGNFKNRAEKVKICFY